MISAPHNILCLPSSPTRALCELISPFARPRFVSISPNCSRSTPYARPTPCAHTLPHICARLSSYVHTRICPAYIYCTRTRALARVRETPAFALPSPSSPSPLTFDKFSSNSALFLWTKRLKPYKIQLCSRSSVG